MRFLHSLLLLAAGAAQAASSWGFDDASVVVGSKKAADRSVVKFSETTPASEPVSLSISEPLKVLLTAKEGGKAKRPHQAFLVLREPSTGLEAPFPMSVKDNGKAVVEIKQADLPVQLAVATEPLQASVVLASFGSSEGLSRPVFDVQVVHAPDSKPVVYEKPLRYGKQELIHHIFKQADKTPPKIVSVAFAIAVVVTIPAIFYAWSALGANLAHLRKAVAAAPASHVLFLASILLMEGVFFLYYSGSLNLFQILPFVGAFSFVTYLSSSGALSEVYRRRLAGER